MTEIDGDLWDFHKSGEFIAITTNGFVRKNNTCVMGRGTAFQAATRFPSLPLTVGRLIKRNGLRVELIESCRIVIFPVKYVWWDKADIELIKTSAHEVVKLLESKFLPRLFMPRPGCGNGQLEWDFVRSQIEPILKGSNVVIVNK